VAAVCTLLDITEREQREKEVRRLNETLERTVREIESFSHTASHDLKAPLRAMVGFSEALLLEHGQALNEQARGYAQRIHAAGKHMSRLVDDLVDLTRITNDRMGREPVSLGKLARSIADDLAASAPERRVEWRIGQVPAVHGDERLLRLALAHLLGNAWKFTARAPRALIEFGARSEGDETVFYVRDDGIGFDMRYAERLFGAFQTLHRAEEFEGNGIGLAIAQRIIHRHGGRIWAEGAVGRGATFSFTL
jgi:light-regulated signal transduction histidine kinase (bacteriophytochrome)